MLFGYWAGRRDQIQGSRQSDIVIGDPFFEDERTGHAAEEPPLEGFLNGCPADPLSFIQRHIVGRVPRAEYSARLFEQIEAILKTVARLIYTGGANFVGRVTGGSF